MSRVWTTKDISVEWLEACAERIHNGTSTITAEAQQVEFVSRSGTIFIDKLHWKTLSKVLKQHELFAYKSGREGKTEEIIPLITDHVLDFYSSFKCGITKMYEICNKKQILGNKHIPRTAVEAIYNTLIHQKHERVIKQPKPRVRYVCDKVNGIWHGDIHNLYCKRETKYLYALIDDCSRYIICAVIIEKKNSRKCGRNIQ